MLHIENEYEIPIDSIYYQNNTDNSTLRLKNSQNIINYNLQAIETNSNITDLCRKKPQTGYNNRKKIYGESHSY